MDSPGLSKVTPASPLKDKMEELNYKAMWETLQINLVDVEEKEVTGIGPYVVLGYMGFIEQEETLKLKARHEIKLEQT